MERADRPPLSTVFAPGSWSALLELDEAAAHHARVKRLSVGDQVRVASGDGRRAMGTISVLAKGRLAVVVAASTVETIVPLPQIEIWAPVGDRERMLFLGEKCVELGASAWRPVVYRRSRSVAPRGEGVGFREKLRLRMIAALEQSGTAWLPRLHAETDLAGALSVAAAAPGVLLDPAGDPLAPLATTLRPPVTIAFGPEGGLEPEEHAAFSAAGWRTASLGPNLLRFETAGIAALAIVRSLIR